MQIIVVVGQPNNNDFDNGISERFNQGANNLIDKLVKELSFREKEDIIRLPSGNNELITALLGEIFLNKPREDSCLFYLGHGDKSGWSVTGYENNPDDEKNIVDYEKLRLIFAGHDGNLIFVNDCCYALAAEAAMESRFSRYLLIGATPKDTKGSGDIWKRAVHCWKDHKPFQWTLGSLRIDGECNEIKLWQGSEELNALMYPPARKLLGYSK
ncbi:MAG: hypothetical protein A3I89_01665 [Candidatus Harrisonbacteria bacterium RIFCSPLOWO2_02_FULL_41_11]|uniref:Caspase family p20 domain-containing protein n=1 Tax=Candidatus Harrisonbacteria bacterium RIFCSPHIGHO2_02_FULL_42_16 TaxID=1798404 RepID=A0A1G1ZJA3_9BACT|nr:MAG: hypothetical protein A3B92_00560 [Candidatus Harrisonbacteria bacterium RIFCSPHIGHO2_02_FULL_42_16]OGY67446.1 MAG: hypothetical protein A3I89_01665 [Candidatus Harrisonbacteria bacterium RIFCSPLOWO2_02_FULL_41_11]